METLTNTIMVETRFPFLAFTLVWQAFDCEQDYNNAVAMGVTHEDVFGFKSCGSVFFNVRLTVQTLEDYKAYKAAGFDRVPITAHNGRSCKQAVPYKEYKGAVAAGFTTGEEFKAATEEGFPTAKEWRAAKAAGFLNIGHIVDEYVFC